MDIDPVVFDVNSPLGVPQRHEHTCSKGDRPLVVTKIENGWVYYCQRCRKGGKKSVKGLSPERSVEFYKKLHLKPENEVGEVRLPYDFTTDIPPAGKAWLYGWGLTDDDIEFYNIGYSEYYNRVIMPVYTAGELVYWQGRNLGEITRANPKYLNVRSKGRKNIYFRCVDQHTVRNHVVICEDILSGIRVGHVTDTYSLLSAHVTDDLILHLSNYERIDLWLDPDKTIEMVDWMTRYQALGVNIGMVRSSHDPKWYSTAEIKMRLE
jgi:hypothetical protein